MCDIYSSDDEDLRQKAFAVYRHFDDEVDDNQPPTSGQDYLRRVIKEAKKEPAIVVANLSEYNFGNSYKVPTILKCPVDKAPPDFLPDLKWQTSQEAEFSKIRQKVVNYKAQFLKNFKEDNLQLPPINNLNAWLRFCLGVQCLAEYQRQPKPWLDHSSSSDSETIDEEVNQSVESDACSDSAKSTNSCHDDTKMDSSLTCDDTKMDSVLGCDDTKMDSSLTCDDTKMDSVLTCDDTKMDSVLGCDDSELIRREELMVVEEEGNLVNSTASSKLNDSNQINKNSFSNNFILDHKHLLLDPEKRSISKIIDSDQIRAGENFALCGSNHNLVNGVNKLDESMRHVTSRRTLTNCDNSMTKKMSAGDKRSGKIKGLSNGIPRKESAGRKLETSANDIIPLKENREKTLPTLNIVCRMNQPTIVKVLSYHLEWMQKIYFNNLQGLWIYALLACLEKPLEPETCSILRSLVLLFRSIRCKLKKKKVPTATLR